MVSGQCNAHIGGGFARQARGAGVGAFVKPATLPTTGETAANAEPCFMRESNPWLAVRSRREWRQVGAVG